MSFIGAPEIILVIAVVIILFFGKDKVLGWARTFGQAKGEFDEAKKEIKKPGKKKKKKK